MPSISSRVAVAVHILVFMAWRRNVAVTSEKIAESVNTNPVVVRRIMGTLRKAGMVTVQPGVGGGAQLARPPSEISLLEVYRAVESEALFSLHRQPPCRDCGVGNNIQDVLQTVFDDARGAMEQVLGRVSVEDVFGAVAERVNGAGCVEGVASGGTKSRGEE